MKYHEESDKILTTLNDNLKRSFDGCESILELKKANFQWKQMEWIGWYMEYKVRTILVEKLGGEEGPKYGNTSFDYILTYPWDIKAHIENSSSHPWVILNDCEAIANALQE